MPNAFALITHKPQEIYFDFLNKFTKYDIYVIIDDNLKDYTYLNTKYTNITFVQIDNSVLHNTGFINCSRIGDKITTGYGWDKAVYFFSNIKKNEYKNVWYSEEDVFFYDENTLLTIDQKYEDYDILCNSSFEDGKLDEWMWNSINICLDPPYYCGMMCCCRFSQKMFEKINEYVSKNKTLFFIEALFPTIAKKNNLKYCVNPEEFLTITYRNVFEMTQFDRNTLYHPMKNLQNHIVTRDYLSTQNKNK